MLCVLLPYLLLGYPIHLAFELQGEVFCSIGAETAGLRHRDCDEPLLWEMGLFTRSKLIRSVVHIISCVFHWRAGRLYV